ncbi:MAG: HlyD family efflux transporter periplasmic adaptor subunit [Bacillota bacterium]
MEAVSEIKLPNRRKGLFLLLGSLVIIVAGIGYWWWHGRQDQPRYISMPVMQGSIINAISATGMVSAVKSTGLDFKNSGEIKKVNVKAGDRVKAGQVLASLDTADLEVQLIKARAALNSAEAKLRQLQDEPTASQLAQSKASLAQAQIAYNSAEAALKRNQILFDGKALAQMDLDKSISDRDTALVKLQQAQADLETLEEGAGAEDIAAAKAQVDSAEAELTLARNNLDSADLRAPFDGIISAVRGEVGQRTSGGGNSSNDNDIANSFIALITPELQVKAQVNEADIGKVKTGQPATFTVNAFPDKSFNGKVSSISAEATTVSNVQLYDVIISLIDPDTSLKGGMSASVEIIVAQKDGVITVPRAAVTFAAGNRNLARTAGTTGVETRAGNLRVKGTPSTSGNGENTPQSSDSRSDGTTAPTPENTGMSLVFVLKDGQPEARRVVTGLSDERNMEVQSGLKVGEQVIIGNAATGNRAATSGATSSGSSNRSQQQQGQMMFRMGRPD